MAKLACCSNAVLDEQLERLELVVDLEELVFAIELGRAERACLVAGRVVDQRVEVLFLARSTLRTKAKVKDPRGQGRCGAGTGLCLPEYSKTSSLRIFPISWHWFLESDR